MTHFSDRTFLNRTFLIQVFNLIPSLWLAITLSQSDDQFENPPHGFQISSRNSYTLDLFIGFDSSESGRSRPRSSDIIKTRIQNRTKWNNLRSGVKGLFISVRIYLCFSINSCPCYVPFLPQFRNRIDIRIVHMNWKTPDKIPS